MACPQRIVIRRARVNQLRPKPTDSTKLGFGRYFSDHFFATEFDRTNGWHLTRIEPSRPLQLDPAALCLHYGQEVFEGLKAYRGQNDEIQLFRWQRNAERLRNSCKRLMMETVEEEIFGRAIKTLVLLDKDWIPKASGCSLYIRPTLIATDPFLGVRPGDEYAFYVIVGPVGSYYANGFAPVPIWVSDEDVRAVKGGLGEAKTAANYAHSLCAQQKAVKLGYSQVLWLDAIEHRWVEEVGTSNVFFRIEDEIVTPPLAGTILPGVTRDSVIQICRHWGMTVVERPISIDEIVEGVQTGKLREAFGTGTAAVISPIGALGIKGQHIDIGKGQCGEISKRLYDYLTRIQFGQEEDIFGWVERIDHLDLESLACGE
ncbi:MAG: branched chain amino acid aminotransferase [Deltaproteobacteria bacterium RIFOXYA12_FULL_58_15]|nr:MAG: branched chain amino acid aminotransferase [Deltaproteobacteria bacterium RIFOXYA12_FULL_58_15]OGR12379.1 MAG: branched chain amino acid aminotransferase [Deltaproteobacteria bacterium RIFOXYB12_FULL_58_9]